MLCCPQNSSFLSESAPSRRRPSGSASATGGRRAAELLGYVACGFTGKSCNSVTSKGCAISFASVFGAGGGAFQIFFLSYGGLQPALPVPPSGNHMITGKVLMVSMSSGAPLQCPACCDCCIKRWSWAFSVQFTMPSIFLDRHSKQTLHCCPAMRVAVRSIGTRLELARRVREKASAITQSSIKDKQILRELTLEYRPLRE